MRESIKYIYDVKGRKYGCVVALRQSDNSPPMIGISRCNMKEDNFSKKKAVKLAKERALKWGYVTVASDAPPSDWFPNNHISKYLQGFSNVHEEFKFMEAIEFVIKRTKPKEPNAEPTWAT